MSFPTRSALSLVLALTRLWTLKPVYRQERTRSAHSGLRNSRPTSIAKHLAGEDLGQEAVEMMKQHPVENGPLGMSRAIDSCYGRNKEPKIEPGS
jgi:hypothetical protein